MKNVLVLIVLLIGCSKAEKPVAVAPTQATNDAKAAVPAKPQPDPQPIAVQPSQPTPPTKAVVAAKEEPKLQPVVFDAGGLRIGDPLTEEWAYSHCPAKDEGKTDIECNDYIKTADGNILLLFQFEESKLIGVTLSFDAVCFNTLVRSYTDKFGTPPHEQNSEILTTRIGGKYENQIVTWNTTDGDFTLRKYGTDITNGYGILATPQLMRYHQKQQKAKQSDLKGKL